MVYKKEIPDYGDGVKANTPFDDFSNFYHKNSSGKVISNRLYHVNDAIAASVQNDDIDDQGATTSIVINQNTNYRYDELGNLNQDE